MSDGLDELDRNGGGTNRCIGIISVELVSKWIGNGFGKVLGDVIAIFLV